MAPGTPSTETFDVFISYSHAADGLLAPALQSGLQSLRKPWYRRRALRVFRDKTSLSATPHLWSTIEAALRGSRFFILLASPQAAESPWVRRELEWWRREREPRTLLIALTDGTIGWNPDAHDFDWPSTTALPQVLAGFFDEEPLWVDLRRARDEQHLALRDPRFREGVAELAAPVHGIGKDALIGDDVVQHRRTLRTARAAVAVLVLLAVAATVAGILAVRQAAETARQRDLAEAQARVATSRALAAESSSLQGDQLDLSLLLAVQAARTEPTTQARQALLDALVGRPDVVDYLRHHADPVSGLAFAPDGSRLASADTKGDVVLWRVPEGRGEVLQLPDEFVGDLAFDPTGTVLAVAGDAVTLVDATAGDVRGTLDIADMGVSAVAFDGDGSRLAAVGCRSVDNYCSTGLLKIWDVATEELITDVVLDPLASLSAVAFHPDGSSLATGGAGGEVTVVGLGGEVTAVRLPEEHPDEVEALVFTADGQLITASGSSTPVPDDPAGPATPTVLTWDLGTGTAGSPLELPLISQGAQPLTIALSRDGDTVLTVGDHHLPWLHDLSGAPLRGGPLTGHRSTVWSADFSPDGRLLATGEEDGTIVVWRIAGDAAPDDRLVERRAMQGTWARSIALSSDAATVAVGDSDGVTLLDGSTLQRVARVDNSDAFLAGAALSFSPDDRLLAVGSVFAELDLLGNLVDGTERAEIALVDAVSGRPVRDPISVPGYLYGMAFRPGTATVAVALSLEETSSGSVGRVVLVDTATGRATGELVGDYESVQAFAFNPDGSVLATGHAGGVVRLWRMDDRQEYDRLTLPDPTDVTALAFDPSGRRLAVGTGRQSSTEAGDGMYTSVKTRHTVHVWDLDAEPLLVQQLPGHADRAATSLAFNGDGTELAVGTSFLGGTPDAPLSVWDVATGQQRIAPRGLAGEVSALSVARGADGFVVAAGGMDGVMVAQLDDETWIELACDIAGRDLTEDEWASFVGPLPYRTTC